MFKANHNCFKYFITTKFNHSTYKGVTCVCSMELVCARVVASLQAAWPRLSACDEAHSGPKGWRLERRQHRRGVFGRLSDKPSKRALEQSSVGVASRPITSLLFYALFCSRRAQWTKNGEKIGPALTHGWGWEGDWGLKAKTAHQILLNKFL